MPARLKVEVSSEPVVERLCIRPALDIFNHVPAGRLVTGRWVGHLPREFEVVPDFPERFIVPPGRGIQRSMRGTGFLIASFATMLSALIGCSSPMRAPVVAEPVPPISADVWREVREELWTASMLAQSEADAHARQAMREWMDRVRALIDTEFVPWYSGYWTQQWIGLKAGWYEMNGEDEEESVEHYLAQYLQERFYELVLEPAGVESDPQTITKQAAALYVQLLSGQMRRIRETHAVPTRSLQKKLRQIPLIALSGAHPTSVSLSEVVDRSDLTGIPAYEALIDHADSLEDPENLPGDNEYMEFVAEDSVARHLEKLPVRAGGGAAATLVGEALGLFISVGVAAWTAAAHEQEKPEIESQLKDALDAALEDMWRSLMEDPDLGVLYPVNHMSRQIETGLFATQQPDLEVPF